MKNSRITGTALALVFAIASGASLGAEATAPSRDMPGMTGQQGATGPGMMGQGGMMGPGMMGQGGMMGPGMMGMMGCPMMSGGMMGHGGMRHAMPMLPPGNEKLQLQMHAEIMQKVGEIVAKYAAQIKQ
jgi:hypothetical protein